MSIQNTISENDGRPPVDPSIMAQANNGKLTDVELAEVEGAVRGKTNPMVWISMKCGVYCGQFDTTRQKIVYRPCPRCGKPMHSEWYASKWYCDPCNFSEYNPRRADWGGSEQDLIAAAK